MKNVQKYQLCCSPLMSTLFIVLACHWCLQKKFLSGVHFLKYYRLFSQYLAHYNNELLSNVVDNFAKFIIKTFPSWIKHYVVVSFTSSHWL